MSEWRETTTAEIIAPLKGSLISGPFGSNISSKYFVNAGVPVIRGNNLSLDIGTRFIDNGFVFITQSKAEELNTWADKDDIIFTAAGTIGQVGLIENTTYNRYIISNKQIRLRIDKSKALPRYVYYWFASPQMTEKIISMDTGSTIPLINLSVVRMLPIMLPPLPTQCAIAEVLSSFDDKIDLLTRQNATLEALAQTYFRQWFVEEAREDWEIKKLSDFGTIVCGKTPSTKIADYYGDDVPFLKIPDMHGKLYVFDTADHLSLRGAKSQANKTIAPNSICVSCIATVGLVVINAVECQTNQQINSLSPFDASYLYYLFCLMRNYTEELLALGSGGTTVGNVSTSLFSGIDCYYPDKNSILSFNNCAIPLFDKIYSNTKQIQTLQKLRDTLLPKLISGEVRVKH